MASSVKQPTLFIIDILALGMTAEVSIENVHKVLDNDKAKAIMADPADEYRRLVAGYIVCHEHLFNDEVLTMADVLVGDGSGMIKLASSALAWVIDKSALANRRQFLTALIPGYAPAMAD